MTLLPVELCRPDIITMVSPATPPTVVAAAVSIPVVATPIVPSCTLADTSANVNTHTASNVIAPTRRNDGMSEADSITISRTKYALRLAVPCSDRKTARCGILNHHVSVLPRGRVCRRQNSRSR